MTISNAQKHIDSNHEINCPRCGSTYVNILSVKVLTQFNTGVQITHGCTQCEKSFEFNVVNGDVSTTAQITFE